MQGYGRIGSIAQLHPGNPDRRQETKHKHGHDERMTYGSDAIEEEQEDVEQKMQLEIGTDEPTDHVTLERKGCLESQHREGLEHFR